MPITKSAKKALRQSVTRRERNTTRKEAYKKGVKFFRKLVSEKKSGEAQESLKTAFKALDKAAKTGVIKKNKASRLKSRLAKALARSAKS
ncbi:MAG: 30S ribosomal protein S20 [Parcubacteria group bacterium LiPW_15]|nr:MAG: 30S ribosomal protein S20 [Parcubacteria group bacterium LiPW_15]